MTRQQRARALRAGGVAMEKIAMACGISPQWAYKIAGDVARGAPPETESTVVRFHPHNGGCSTQSGMRGVSMPRILALHGELGELA